MNVAMAGLLVRAVLAVQDQKKMRRVQLEVIGRMARVHTSSGTKPRLN
jgi:hypothetical protein